MLARSRSALRTLAVGAAVAVAGPLVMSRFVHRAYRRLGPRYPAVALSGEFFAAYPFIAVTVAVLALYVGMSAGEFLRIFLVFAGFQLVYTVLIAGPIRREAAPITAWLRGARAEQETLAAWHSAASLPLRVVRFELAWPHPVAPVGWIFNGLACVYATWELGLPAYDWLIIYAGAFVYMVGVTGLRFFLSERVLEPVLDQIARSLPAGARLQPARLPLRWRLLVALPGINLLTGVVAVGITGHDLEVTDLGLAVVVSLVIAGTISLIYTVLLSDSVTRPIGRLREAAELVGTGDFTTSVPVTTTDETGDLARSFNEMTAGLAERERIREAFGTYVDREVAEHILREGTSLAGEEVEVTMMFIDVRDFTGFAERSSATEVVATINRLFERAVPIIHAHQGHVDKFVGDGLLAVFGAPRRQADHADRALAAALEIERGVREEFAGELEIGMGLNSGIVVAGNVGGAGRLEFSVIGDAVNIAARVESATRKTGDVILLSENTRRLLGADQVEVKERPMVPLKGKTQAIALYAPAPLSRERDPLGDVY